MPASISNCLAARWPTVPTPGDAYVIFAGIGLRLLDQALHVRHAQAVAHRQHVGNARHHGDRHPFRRVERHGLVEQLVHRDRAGRAEQQRVAVRLGPRDLGRPDVARRGAAQVLDDRPSVPISCSARRRCSRASRSVPPPAGNGTAIFTGRDGNVLRGGRSGKHRRTSERRQQSYDSFHRQASSRACGLRR